MRLAGTDWLKAGALAMAALACFAVSPAAAASSVCRQLEAQLTAASRGGNSARYVKYDRAVTAQREQLDLARSRARDGGCGFAFFGGRTGCGRINAQIDKMQRNLDFLQRTRAKLAGLLGNPLPFDSFGELRSAMIADHPQLGSEGLLKLKWSPPKLDAKASGPVNYPIRDFYLTNAITRSSPTMHLCSEEILHGPRETLVAAE